MNFIILLISLMLVSAMYSLFNYHPMYSLLFFILILINLVFYLFINDYEFLTFLIALIYFGAILILFFNIIILINLQQTIRDNRHLKKIPITSFLFIFFICILINLFKNSGLLLNLFNLKIQQTALFLTIENIGLILFSNFAVYVIIVGLILFVTLIGLVMMLVSNKNIKINLKI